MTRTGVRRKAPSPAPPVVGEVLRSSGNPLDRGTQTVMGVAFGQDFSGVRVHTDPKAARSAQAVNADAYTVGEHVVFGSGRYRPGDPGGHRLLAHELAHVVQQRETPGVIRRQACGHDGRQPACGGYRWSLIDIATDAVTDEDLDHRIVDQGMRGNFGGTWATQVQTPPNAVKGGRYRGRADGLRVSSSGALRVEVVEVKSRSTQFNGGCALATREATEYVRLLNGLAPHVVTISQVLSARPELRTSGAPKAGQLRALAAAGVDLDQPGVREAWNFFRSLEERLGGPFSRPFTAFTAVLNSDGTPGTSYPAGPPVLVDCEKRGKPGVKSRQLMFQVNGAGGVTYGCTDTACQTEEEQRKEERVQVPVAEKSQEEQQPADVTVPVLVGAGAATATGIGVAAARRRAAEIAARRLAARLAEREAAKHAGQAAWRRAAEAAAERRAAAGAGKRVVGKAVGKALVIAEVAAGLLLVVSGEAKAEIGPGKSSLEALYQVMTRNGAPPSPETRELIENDPVLRRLAERAAETGDMSGLQRELDRQGLEFLRDHAHELSEEELDILLSSANARGAGGPPPTGVEQLKTAIAAERERRRTGAPAPAPGVPAPAPGTEAGGGGGTGPRTAERTPGGGRPPVGAAGAAERHPELSAEVRGELAAAPAARRKVVEALVSGRRGEGPRVTDDSVRRILAAVPADLTPEQSDRLIEQVAPAGGKSVDEIVESVRKAVAAVRGSQEQRERGAEAEEAAPERTGAEAEEARAEYIRSIIGYINTYPGWADIPAGSVFIRPVDRTASLGTTALGTPISVIVVGRTSSRPPVRFAGTGRAAVTRRTDRLVTIELRSSVLVVGENGRTVTVPAGHRYENSRLVGVGR